MVKPRLDGSVLHMDEWGWCIYLFIFLKSHTRSINLWWNPAGIRMGSLVGCDVAHCRVFHIPLSHVGNDNSRCPAQVLSQRLLQVLLFENVVAYPKYIAKNGRQIVATKNR